MPNKEVKTLEKKLKELRLDPPGLEIVSLLNKLADVYLHSDPRKSEVCALEAKDLAEKLGLLVEQAKSCNTLGTINQEAGNIAEAMSYCRESMEICEELGDKSGIATVHGTMASTYRSQGMMDKALEHYHESLRGKHECNASQDELALCYLNIGSCYSSLFRLDLAESFYENARKIWEESGNRMKLAYVYNNIGSVYGKKEEMYKAEEYFHKALDIREDIGDKKGIASSLGNLGSLHQNLGDYETALSFFTRSLELFEEIGNMRGVARSCYCVGGLYTLLGRFDEAEELLDRGLSIAKKLSMKDWEIHSLENMSDLYEAKGDLKVALMYSRELKVCLEEYLSEKSMEKIAKLQVQFQTEQKEKEAEIYRLKNIELTKVNDQLRDALDDVKKLQGLLPICAHCKKIRDDNGYWKQIEFYISDHSDAEFTHGICPDCMVELYGEDYVEESE